MLWGSSDDPYFPAKKMCEASNPSSFCYMSSYAQVFLDDPACYSHWWMETVARNLYCRVQPIVLFLLGWQSSVEFLWPVRTVSESSSGCGSLISPQHQQQQQVVVVVVVEKKAWWWWWCIVATLLIIIFILIPIFNKKSNTIPLPHGHYGLASVTAHYNTGYSLIRMIQDPMSPGLDGLRAINTDFRNE